MTKEDHIRWLNLKVAVSTRLLPAFRHMLKVAVKMGGQGCTLGLCNSFTLWERASVKLRWIKRSAHFCPEQCESIRLLERKPFQLNRCTRRGQPVVIRHTARVVPQAQPVRFHVRHGQLESFPSAYPQYTDSERPQCHSKQVAPLPPKNQSRLPPPPPPMATAPSENAAPHPVASQTSPQTNWRGRGPMTGRRRELSERGPSCR